MAVGDKVGIRGIREPTPAITFTNDDFEFVNHGHDDLMVIKKCHKSVIEFYFNFCKTM
ncbi:hypothetical protein SESBI_05087 [Sesbania bispinosa]|nr:hypothetical protein SESBI_05087 [Sesbania bispinosa]